MSHDSFYDLQPDALAILGQVPNGMGRHERLHYEFIKSVLEAAQKRRTDAGYSGAMNDGGAAALEREVEAYVAALHRTIPAGWSEMHQQFQRNNDPEFKEYQRMHAKFGNL